ncbi:MAG: hypothetical protein ACOY93_07415 [Bacillota bacterium]
MSAGAWRRAAYPSERPIRRGEGSADEGGEPAADQDEVSDARFWPVEEALASPEVVSFTQECIRKALRGGGLGPNPSSFYTAHRWRLFSV